MLSRLLCGLCCSQEEEEKPKPPSKTQTPVHGTPNKTKAEIISTSQSSHRHLILNQETFEGFVDSLKERDSTEFFKIALTIDNQDLPAKEFNRKLWERLLYLEKMVTQQLMLQQIAEIPNTVIRSWTTSEPRIISVDPIGETVRDIKERAKVVNENMSLRRYLKGWDCIDKTIDLRSSLEEINQLKLYISKLCSPKGKYLIPRETLAAPEQLLVERMTFIYGIVAYFLITSICIFRFAPQMNAFEVYEVKQSMEDVLEYLSSAESTFKNSVSTQMLPSPQAPVNLSDSYLDALTAFHIQKSSNPDVDTNDALYHCYRRLLDSSVAELDLLQWRKDKDAFASLQDFLVKQIQRRMELDKQKKERMAATVTVPKDEKVNFGIDKVLGRDESQRGSGEVLTEGRLGDAKLSHSIVTKDSGYVLSEYNKGSFGKPEDKKGGSSKNVDLAETKDKRQSLDHKDAPPKSSNGGMLSKQPLAEVKLGDSLGPGPAPLPPKKGKKKKTSRTFAAVQEEIDENDEQRILEDILAKSDSNTQYYDDLSTIKEASVSLEGGSTTTEFVHPRFGRNSKQPSVMSYDKSSATQRK